MTTAGVAMAVDDESSSAREADDEMVDAPARGATDMDAMDVDAMDDVMGDQLHVDGFSIPADDDPPAIERLAALGFPFERAAEAFFACEKNEEMAANYLFDSGGD